jgi:hypothetical protein
MTEIISNQGRQRGQFSVIFHRQDEEQLEMFGSEIEEEAENNTSIPANDEAPKSRREVTDDALLDYMMKMNCSLFPTREGK